MRRKISSIDHQRDRILKCSLKLLIIKILMEVMASLQITSKELFLMIMINNNIKKSGMLHLRKI